MVISTFSPKTDAYFNSKKTMVGAYLDRKHVDQITLYALLHDTSKASILKKLIHKFLKEMADTDDLIKKVVKIAAKDWIQFKKDNHTQPDKMETHQEIYITEFKRGLKSKKIHKQLIEKLVILVEERMK